MTHRSCTFTHTTIMTSKRFEIIDLTLDSDDEIKPVRKTKTRMKKSQNAASKNQITKQDDIVEISKIEYASAGAAQKEKKMRAVDVRTHYYLTIQYIQPSLQEVKTLKEENESLKRSLDILRKKGAQVCLNYSSAIFRVFS
jgi:hypothetical protein